METVNVTVQDDTLAHDLVDGIVVRVFDSTGTTHVTEGTTGSVNHGAVQFTLLGGLVYQLRFYMNGGSILSPQYVSVSSTLTNNFLITASMFSLPEATNIRLCRASGYIWGPDGRIKPGIDIALIPTFNPLVVDGYGVMGERVNIRSDAAGYICADLLRSGIYDATIEGHENYLRQIHVPDRSSVNIFHLLFPIVASVSYSPAGPWVLAVGASLELTPIVMAMDYRTLPGTGNDDTEYTIDDTTIASVSVSGTVVTITGNATGITTLRATRRDNSVVYIPDPGVIGGELTITVT